MKQARRNRAVGVLMFIAIFSASVRCAGEAPKDRDPKAEALLRGVEMARTREDSARVSMNMTFKQAGASFTELCLAELSKSSVRFERYGVGGKEGEVVVRNGDEFMGFRRKQHQDVHLYDVDRAVGVRGDIAFDPRVLGLHDLMTADMNVKACLWYNAKRLSVVGEESIDGVKVWRVRAERGDVVRSEYWIEEPSFRLHRRTTEAKNLQIDIRSEFDRSNQLPFPKRVVAKRVSKKGNSSFEKVFEINSFEYGIKIAKDRFSMAKMNIPLNTPVVDYRTNQRTGYWDGGGLSQTPIRQFKPAP